MGVARLSKLTIISPRSEYEDVVRALAKFEDFHPVEAAAQNFDPAVQELTVRVVRLFAQADQATKDLDLQLMPGQIDIVFRGVKVQKSEFAAGTWKELLGSAEAMLSPIAEKVKSQKALLQKAAKEETDAQVLKDALEAFSGFSWGLGGLSDLRLLRGIVSTVATERVDEFRKSLPGAIFLSQAISKEQSLVLVVVEKADEAKLDKTLKVLELKPLVIPEGFSQNPAEAYREVSARLEAAKGDRLKAEEAMAAIREKDGSELLAVRELSEAAREMLDDARVSGGMKRLATISGYIPAQREAEANEAFGRWVVHYEPVRGHGEAEKAPTLVVNRSGLNIFQPITNEQGIPGGVEVDPTPIVSFVFPIFFGMMFGDVGHGLLLAGFMLFVRQRSFGTIRQWANIFLVAGLSAIVFGVIFGEFFELSLYDFVPIPASVEIIRRAAGAVDTFNFLPTPFAGVNLVLVTSFLIGIAHLTTALALDIYQGVKEGDRTELLLEKIPVLTMYLSGVGYGLAFIGVGFSFNVFKSDLPNQLLGIPNNLLGGVSLAILLPSMLVLFLGKSAAIAAGKLEGSALVALSEGGLEVFERISQFMSNTISYVRLAVMLLVHAALLLIINLMQPWNNPVYIAPWLVLNLLILAFEAFIVYVQDLRLHLYEFFTKFYGGTGVPFRKILPDRARIRIKWT
ncbi:MAG: hypothetical protein HY297_04970 [Thaumarchaeota archaeon]|nr:hypothetical protein [Nitrososphaerota archaeon]